MNKLFIILIFMLCFVLLYAIALPNYTFYSTEKLPIFLISLEKDKARRDLLFKHVKPEFYHAVHGQTVDRSQYVGAKSTLKNGEIGCYLSHIHMLNKAIAKKSADAVLILEDDARITRDTEKNIYEIVQCAPSNWEIIHIGYNMYRLHKDSYYLQKNDYKFEHINYLHGLQGYLVNPRTVTTEKINKLLPMLKPVDLVIPEIFMSYIVDKKQVLLSKYANRSNTQGIN